MANWLAQTFRLNFIPEGSPPKIRVHQYSVGSMVELHGEMFYGVESINMLTSVDGWFSGDVDTNGTVLVAFVRGDGKKFQYELPNPHNALHADGGIFYFQLDENMTAAPGPCVMTIGFDDGSDNVLWTQNFIVDVERHPVQEGEA